MVGLAWVGQCFGPENSSCVLASLLAYSGIGIGLCIGVFQVLGACTQAWAWRLVPG